MEMKELVEEIESLKKNDYENLKTRICTDKKCEIKRNDENFEQIKPIESKQRSIKEIRADFVKSESKTTEVNKMGETIETKTVDIGKYESIISKQEALPTRRNMVRSYNKVMEQKKNLDKLVDKARVENSTISDRVKYNSQVILHKIHLGEKPEIKEIIDYLEPQLEKVENLAENAYDCVVRSMEHEKNINGDLEMIMKERDDYKGKIIEASRDYDQVMDEVKILLDNNISLDLNENQGSNMDVMKLRKLLSAGNNIQNCMNNCLDNYEIRHQEFEQGILFADMLNENVTVGKQLYDDVNVMMRSVRRALTTTPKAVIETAENMYQIDNSMKGIGEYVNGVIDFTRKLSGMMQGLRVGGGNIPGYNVKDARNQFNNLKTGYETLKAKEETTKERMLNLFPQK